MARTDAALHSGLNRDLAPWFLVGLMIILGGCVSPGIVPPKERVASFQGAYIVAMETPPLVNSVANTFGREDTTQPLKAILESNEAWSPTTVLANEASKQLMANGVAATVTARVKPIPGLEDRGVTFMMENWMGPIRAHYNDPGPVRDYRELAATPPRFVLEVSISNYEVGGTKFWLTVHMKMIDPSNGEVIGRVRKSNGLDMPSLEPLDQAFAHDASRFKEIFSETGRQLVSRCLGDLGLLPPKN